MGACGRHMEDAVTNFEFFRVEKIENVHSEEPGNASPLLTL